MILAGESARTPATSNAIREPGMIGHRQGLISSFKIEKTLGMN